MHMSTQPPHDPHWRPWYRHGWVWFLIGIPASAVIAGSVTIWIAVTKADSLVADDYYKEGRAINQRLEKDEEAQRRGITLAASLTPTANGMLKIRVVYRSSQQGPAPEQLRLRMSHPTIDLLDVTATLMPVTTPSALSASGQVFETQVPSIASGKWHVQLEDESSVWRVKSIWIVE